LQQRGNALNIYHPGHQERVRKTHKYLTVTYGSVPYGIVGYWRVMETNEALEVTLHGHLVSYIQETGAGTPVLLVHGVGSSIETWGEIPQLLNRDGRPVVAVDLLGHGGSSLGNGDFSLGANAAVLRDLLHHLGYERAHLVGHSLGGGICLQFSYQFPDMVESLTLISSGGLGPQVGLYLRAATLPGADLVIATATRPGLLSIADKVRGRLVARGVESEVLSARVMDRVKALSEPKRRKAFLATVKSVVGPRGQTVSALEKMKSLDGRKVLIIWGDKDNMIPIAHGYQAHEILEGSTMVVLPNAGHQPHVNEPYEVAQAIQSHLVLVSP
jgi:pimeloyl-ACP methyl ester carboxylesterase